MVGVAPTAAPAWLGGLSASLLLARLDARLHEPGAPAGAEEWWLDVPRGALLRSRLSRNPDCRFDHEIFAPETVGDVPLASLPGADARAASLYVDGDAFVLALTCRACGASQDVRRLARRLRAQDRTCRACGSALVTRGFDVREVVPLADLLAAQPDATPSDLGFTPGEVFTLGEGPRRHLRLATGTTEAAHGLTVCVCGLGNVGSALVEPLARMAGVARIVLIDPDRYEAANLPGQRIAPEDLGRRKVDVQAERLRRIRPDLVVDTFATPLEDVPTGTFAGAWVISALDRRSARMALHTKAWRVGAPYLDAAVDAALRVARVAVHVPGPDVACPECPWDDDDYAAVDQIHACDAVRVAAPQETRP